MGGGTRMRTRAQFAGHTHGRTNENIEVLVSCVGVRQPKPPNPNFGGGGAGALESVLEHVAVRSLLILLRKCYGTTDPSRPDG